MPFPTEETCVSAVADAAAVITQRLQGGRDADDDLKDRLEGMCTNLCECPEAEVPAVFDAGQRVQGVGGHLASVVLCLRSVRCGASPLINDERIARVSATSIPFLAIRQVLDINLVKAGSSEGVLMLVDHIASLVVSGTDPTPANGGRSLTAAEEAFVEDMGDAGMAMSLRMLTSGPRGDTASAGGKSRKEEPTPASAAPPAVTHQQPLPSLLDSITVKSGGAVIVPPSASTTTLTMDSLASSLGGVDALESASFSFDNFKHLSRPTAPSGPQRMGLARPAGAPPSLLHASFLAARTKKATAVAQQSGQANVASLLQQPQQMTSLLPKAFGGPLQGMLPMVQRPVPTPPPQPSTVGERLPTYMQTRRVVVQHAAAGHKRARSSSPVDITTATPQKTVTSYLPTPPESPSGDQQIVVPATPSPAKLRATADARSVAIPDATPTLMLHNTFLSTTMFLDETSNASSVFDEIWPDLQRTPKIKACAVETSVPPSPLD